MYKQNQERSVAGLPVSDAQNLAVLDTVMRTETAPRARVTARARFFLVAVEAGVTSKLDAIGNELRATGLDTTLGDNSLGVVFAGGADFTAVTAAIGTAARRKPAIRAALVAQGWGVPEADEAPVAEPLPAMAQPAASNGLFL